MADINNQLDKTEKELKDVEQQAIKTESAVKKVTEAEQEAMMHAALSAAKIYVKPDKNINKQTKQIREQEKAADNLYNKVSEAENEAAMRADISDVNNNYKGKIKGLEDIIHNKLNIKKYNFSQSNLGYDEAIEAYVKEIDKIIEESELGIDETISLLKEYTTKNDMPEVTNAIKQETIEKLKRFREIDAILDTPEMRKIFGYKKNKKGNRIYSNSIASKSFANITARYKEGTLDPNEEPRYVNALNDYNKIFEFEKKLNKGSKYSRVFELSPFLNKNFNKGNTTNVTDKVPEQVKAVTDKLNKTEEQLKNIEKQAEKTAKAVNKVSEAENEAANSGINNNNKDKLKGIENILYNKLGINAYNFSQSDLGYDKAIEAYVKDIEKIIKQSKLGIDETISLLKEYTTKNDMPEVTNAIKQETIEKLKRFREIDAILDTPEMRKIFGYKKNKKGNRIYSNSIASKSFANITARYKEGTLDPNGEEYNKIFEFEKKLNKGSKYSRVFELSPFLNKNFNKGNTTNVTDKVPEQVKAVKDKVVKTVETATNAVKENVTEVIKQTDKVPEQVKAVTDKVAKTVETANNAIKENVNITVQNVGSTVNGFTLVGGIAEQVKKQLALVPVGKPYVKGNNFNMYDPDEKQLPAVINDSTTALSTELNNDVIERIKLFYEYLKRIAILKQSLNGNFNIDSGIGAPEGAFSNSINNLADNAQRQQQEEIKNTEKAYENLKNKVSEVMSSIKHAMANVIGVIRTANNILHKVGSTIISVFNGLIHTVQRIIQLFGNLGDRIGLTHRQNNLLKGSFTELKSAIDLVAGAFNKLFNNQFIQQGKKLLGSIQTLNILLGTQLAQSTIEWANNMEEAFGLSAEELISKLREVTAVMYGLGMSTKDVQVGARNLESVGMVLSSINGLSFEETMSKIQSGMKGMTQSIDDLGLSVRESQMDAYLKKLKAQGGEFTNIATSFSQLTEQQRVYVRYAAIMDQFMTKEAYSVERYAESLRTTTGSLEVLNSQLEGLKSTIGTLALGLFSKVLQPLIYIVYYIRQLIIQLGEFLGVKMKLDANLNGGGTVDTTPVEDETDALDEMTDAASKAKGALDDLDHISTMSSSSGSDAGSAGSDFDYSSLLGGYDFADELAKYNSKFIEECKQSLIQMLKDAELSISEFIRKQTGRLIDWDELENNLEQIRYNIKATFMGLIQVAENVFKIIGGLLWSIGDDLNFSNLFEKFTRNIANTVSTINLILERIAPYIQQFYDKYLSKYVIKFGEWLDGKLNVWSEKLHELTMYWTKLTPEQMEGKVDELGTKFENLLTTLKEISIIFKTLFGKDTEADNTFFDDNASENMKKLKETAEKLHGILSGLWDIIKGIAHEIADVNGDGVVDSNDLGVVIDKINEKLEKVRKFIRDHKAEIISLVSEVAKTLGKLAEAKFEVLMSILRFITNPIVSFLIKGVLIGIQGILDFVSKHPLLSFGIHVGLKLAGHAIKNAATALIWKTILGTGTGGGLATAVSGISNVIKVPLKAVASTIGGILKNGLVASIRSVPAAVGVLVLTGALLFEGKKLEEYINEAIETANNIAIDISRTKSGAFGSLGGETVSARKIENWTYDIIKSLRDLYGNKFTEEQTEKALEGFRSMLQQQGDLTPDQIDLIMGNVNRDFKDIKKNTGIGIFGLDSLYKKRLTEDDKQIQEYLKGIIQGTNNASTSIQEDINNTNNSLQYFNDAFASTSQSTVRSLDGTTYQFGQMSDTIGENTTKINTNLANMNTILNEANGNMTGLTTTATSNFATMGNTIKTSCDDAKISLSGLFDKLKNLANNSNFGGLFNNIANVAQSLTGGIKIPKVKGFKGYANGGLPSTGSLFMANEDGNTELVGNFGGYTGVANQSMIISAMENAVYNAVTQALRANGGNGGQTTIEVCKGGVFVGDEAGIRKLANQINNVNATGRTNIANVDFSMT